MRNVTNFTETVTSYQGPLGIDSHFIISTINATHRVGTSARDDAIATLPNDNGAYFLPTAYRGWYYGSTSWPADYLGETTSGSFRRYWGRYTWSQYTNSAANVSTIYGCDTSNRPAVPTAVISRVEASLNQQMLAQNWNIGTMLGELPETIGFILDCLKDLIAIAALVKGRFSKNAIFRFRPKRKKRINKHGPRRLEGPNSGAKGDVFDLKRNRDGSWGYNPKRDRLRRYREAYLNIRNAKGATSAYLAFVYAVQPLLSDVYSAMRTLEEGVNQLQNKRFTVKADASEPIPPPFPRMGVSVAGSQDFTGEWGCKGEVAVKVKSPTLATLDSLGLLDPLSVAWELVPLSFVVDWFIPVGAFIRSLGGHWGLILSHGYRTDYAKWSADIKFVTALKLIAGTPGRITGRALSFDRKLYLTWPMPVPYITGIDSLLEDYEKSFSLLAIGFQRVFK